MTLAFIVLLCSFSWKPAMQVELAPQSPEPAIQSAPEKQQDTASPQAQSGRSQPTPSSSSQAPANPTKSTTTKRKHHKKTTTASNCGVRPTPPQPAGTGSTAQGTSPSDPAGGTASASASGQTSAAAPQNCPPPKIIVRHGGTSEPSIQLEGGPPNGQAAHQRDVVNQLLGVTENNLKKVSGKQLSSNQQDTLSQARAFVRQSRNAIAEGDLDRARTLAWKAETLSEDLIKP